MPKRRTTPLRLTAITGIPLNTWRTEFREADLSRAAKSVGRALADYANYEDSRSVFPSWGRIAADTGYCERTVARAIAELLSELWLVQDLPGYRGQAAQYSMSVPRRLPVSNTESMTSMSDSPNSELESLTSVQESLTSGAGKHDMHVAPPLSKTDPYDRTSVKPMNHKLDKIRTLQKQLADARKMIDSGETKRNWARYAQTLERELVSLGEGPQVHSQTGREGSQGDYLPSPDTR